MKHLKTILFVLAAVISFTACKKGDTGPQGPAGNANVTVYNFGEQTFTDVVNLKLSNISQGKMDSSLILAYYNPSSEAATSWYPIPGAGSGAAYQTRYFVYQSATTPVSIYTFSIRTLKADGTAYGSAVTFKKIKIIMAPASAVLAGGRQMSGVPNIPVDVNDYYAVCRYYGIEE